MRCRSPRSRSSPSCVTTAAVAFVGWKMAGLPLAAAIALGAIVAPPDAAAASAVLGQFVAAAPHHGDPAGRKPAQRCDGAPDLSHGGRRRRRRLVRARQAPRRRLPSSAIGSVVAAIVLAGLLAADDARRTMRQAARSCNSSAPSGSGSLADRLGLSAIITMVVYAMTHRAVAPRRMRPRNGQLLFGLGDRGLRAQRARLRADGPAGAADPRPRCRRERGRALSRRCAW